MAARTCLLLLLLLLLLLVVLLLLAEVAEDEDMARWLDPLLSPGWI